MAKLSGLVVPAHVAGTHILNAAQD